MPYDVLNLATRISEIRDEIEKVTAGAKDKDRYNVLKENVIRLSLLQTAFLKPDKNGNFEKLGKERIEEYKTASSRVIKEIEKLAASPAEEEMIPEKRFIMISSGFRFS